MKKLLLFIIVLLAVSWILQNYTSIKVFDIAKDYWKKVDLSALKNLKLPGLNSPVPTPVPGMVLNIFIRDSKFVPSTGQLKPGATVNWFNEANINHTVTGDNWGSGELRPGEKFSKTFDAAGKYEFHCTIHPEMKGRVEIIENLE